MFSKIVIKKFSAFAHKIAPLSSKSCDLAFSNDTSKLPSAVYSFST
jgi:hypothetical protein